MASTNPHQKIPIFRLAHRYYLYDITSISYLRKYHNILGTFVGTLPQHSQQNVFLGLPLELLAEETRLLVEQGVAFIVDDVELHSKGLRLLKKEERDRYKRALNKHGLELANGEQKRRDDNKEEALNKMSSEQRKSVLAKLQDKRESPASSAATVDDTESESLFAPTSASQSSVSVATSIQDASIKPKCITPTTSHPPIPLPTPPASPPTATTTPPRRESHSAHIPFSPFSPFAQTHQSSTPPAATSTQTISEPLPSVPSLASYALFRYLHGKGYFQSPGLRFGCQYCVYPGDPLRFHSHFLARGYAWDKEIRLMDLVGGGRLGTGVKKSFLIGGPNAKDSPGSIRAGGRGDDMGERTDVHKTGDDVKVFCIEWAGM